MRECYGSHKCMRYPNTNEGAPHLEILGQTLYPKGVEVPEHNMCNTNQATLSGQGNPAREAII